MSTLRASAAVVVFLLAACGVDRIRHSDLDDGERDGGSLRDLDSGVQDGGQPDAGATNDAGALNDAGSLHDAGITDAGPIDAGAPDAGLIDAGTEPLDAGAERDAGSTVDAGTSCTTSGISPELASAPGGPYQNCQGGQIPRIDVQPNTQPFSGCCGELVRVCAVTGFSTRNVLYCR